MKHVASFVFIAAYLMVGFGASLEYGFGRTRSRDISIDNGVALIFIWPFMLGIHLARSTPLEKREPTP